MHGKYDITVENAYIRYEFTIVRNITVIRGQSATGKTTLYEMIRAYNESDDSGITVICDKKLVVLYGKQWERELENITDSIVFIDEQSRFVKSKEFAERIKNTDNYYVLITREKLSELPYSITEVYGIRTSGKYARLVGEYTQNELYRIYGQNPALSFKPDIVITEDTNSGYDFWNKVYKNIKCISAGGKTKVIKSVKELYNDEKRILAIVDGAAFGPEIEEIIQMIKYTNPGLEVYAPESFEYLILSSGILKNGDITEKCEYTYDFADSAEFINWEQFYTKLLTEVTEGTEKQYSKHRLNVYYLSDRNREIILEQVPNSIK